MNGFYIEKLEVNPEVDHLHQSGVILASRTGDCGSALVNFAEAKVILVPDLREPTDPSTVLQLSRIERDEFFTDARKGIQDQNPPAIANAYSNSLNSLNNRIGLVSFAAEAQYSPEAWQYLQDERGASLGLLGRLATLAFVIGSESAAEEVPRAGINHYKQAAEVIKGNKYYAVSNAITAARHERIMGKKGEAAKWTVKAASEAIRAIKSDRPNAKAAARTILRRVSDLRSIKAAQESVLARP